VQARLATALARTLTYAALIDVLDALKRRALGQGHVANAAAAQLLALAKEALPDSSDDDVEDNDPATWTREQRAAYRARLDRALERMEKELEGDGELKEDAA
jgi:hypothetical protein